MSVGAVIRRKFLSNFGNMHKTFFKFLGVCLPQIWSITLIAPCKMGSRQIILDPRRNLRPLFSQPFLGLSLTHCAICSQSTHVHTHTSARQLGHEKLQPHTSHNLNQFIQHSLVSYILRLTINLQLSWQDTENPKQIGEAANNNKP